MGEAAILALEDGTILRGQAAGASGTAVGEVCFNTAMSGYQEICTDPSYARQLVTFTCPHIGNVGTNPLDAEADGVQLAGVVVRDLPRRSSNWRDQEGLADYLRRQGIVAISGVDTRSLTRRLRDAGAQNGCLMAGQVDETEALARARAFPGLKGMDLAREVTVQTPYGWNLGPWSRTDGHREPPAASGGRWRVVAYDYGVKRNILRLLVANGCRVTVVPAHTSAEEVLALSPDGVFLSNGPGDPEPCDYAIAAIRRLLEQRVPLFGICLGHQLLGLAAGAGTEKMKFGHHGANHPVQDLDTGRVMISSQNHGFAVDEASLPEQLRPTHRSLFDGSLQGIALRDAPAFGFQGHPEASPGPHDLAPLFEKFVDLMATRPAGA